MMPRIFLLFTVCVLCAQAFRDQSTAVQGRYSCNNKSFSGGKVKLIDVDTGRPDDLMAKGVTDNNGQYSLSGYASDLVGSIDPVVEIKFKCGTLFEKCYHFKVPDQYVTDGKIPKKTFNAPDVELASVKPNC